MCIKMSETLCLLCKGMVTKVEDPLDNSNFTKCSNTPFRVILENALDHYLLILNSELHLCHKCIDLVNEFDSADNTCKMIKQQIVDYCIGFEVQAKKLDVACQTENILYNELSEIKESTDEISDNVEFEFVNNNEIYEYETDILSKVFNCDICSESFTSENEMTIHWKELHHITIRKTKKICRKRNPNTERKTDLNNKVTIKKLKNGHVLNKPIVIGNIKLDEYLSEEDYKDNIKIFISPKPTKKIIKQEKANTFKRPIIINDMNISNTLLEYSEDIVEPTKLKVKPCYYKCLKCSKKMKVDEKSEHNCDENGGEAPYICEMCGQIFKRKGDLTAHMPLHTGVYPYVCSFCTKPFTKKASLQRHLPIHTGEIQYQCDLCGKSFIHNSSFTTHMALHAGRKNFKCVECGVSVFSRTHLVRHMRVHTGEKPYSCSMCSKRFAERYNLYTHLKVHIKSTYSC